MASKQELEAQVASLTAEVESLKSAQPADVQLLKAEIEQLKRDLTDADVQASVAKAALKEEAQKLRLELITAHGESQSLLEQLKAKPASSLPFEPDKTVGNIRDLKEKMRRGECHDEQLVLLARE